MSALSPIGVVATGRPLPSRQFAHLTTPGLYADDGDGHCGGFILILRDGRRFYLTTDTHALWRICDGDGSISEITAIFSGDRLIPLT